MSNFSMILTQLMEQKAAENSEVISYTGINRSTFFKVRRGTRSPSGLEMVEKIAAALRLNEEERQLLLDAYEIDLIGPYKYYGMKAVQQFFQTEGRLSEMPLMTVSLPDYQTCPAIRVFRDAAEIRMMICGMLNEKSSKILIMESSMSDIYITGIPQASTTNPAAEYCHIFTLDNTETVGIDHQLYNVNCFRNVMQIMNRTAMYYPRYNYSTIAAISDRGRPVNFILSDRFLLTYSVGYESAVLYTDPDMLNLYRDIFEEAKRKLLYCSG